MMFSKLHLELIKATMGKQMSVALRRNLKLSARYYGPFEIIEKFGVMAYRLKLPEHSKLHPVFYVSWLKKKVGASVEVQENLPITLDDTQFVSPTSQAILKRNREEVLVHWQGLSPADATREDSQELCLQFLEIFLGDKEDFYGGVMLCISLSPCPLSLNKSLKETLGHVDILIIKLF